MAKEPTHGGVSRRSFLKGVSVAAATPSLLSASSPTRRHGRTSIEVLGPDAVPLNLTVNSKKTRAMVEPRTTLLELMRERLELTGAKEACDLGSCGACTVLLDGRTVNACMVLALDCEGAELATIEGLGDGDTLHPVQQAFVAEDALQCGFCTPGMVMSVHACLAADPTADRDTIRRATTGNICRCGTYPRVFAAAERARRMLRGDRK